MAYPVYKGNSVQFVAGDEKLAFAVVLDYDLAMYSFGLFRSTPQGWLCPVFGEENGFIEQNLTNDKVMAFGSVANYMKAQFPVMQGKLARYLGASIPKPDQSDKPACVGYDLALDVVYNPASGTFSLNKEPPLSHAR